MSRIAVGLPSDAMGFAQWVSDSGGDHAAVKLLTVGTIATDGVDRWIGVPPPATDMVRVNLRAPEPRDEEPQWLEFRPGEWEPDLTEAFCCWTADLVAAVLP